MSKSIQSAFEQYQSGNLEQAENIAGGILKADPDNSEALHLLGLISYQHGNHVLALKYIRKALKSDPKNADAYYDMGNILQDKGELAKAITNYKKTLKIRPEYAEAYNNMGIALHDNMQLDKAIKSYQEALRIDPDYAETHNNIGVAFQEKRLLEEAITHFQKALLLKPEYANAYHNLVEAVEGKGHKERYGDPEGIIYAIYRCSYGEDFIQESIKSINDYVDRIFIFWDDKPAGNVTKCRYKGEDVRLPRKFDNVITKIRELDNHKIELIYDHWEAVDNQLTHFVNDIILSKYERPSVVLFLEVTHVFRNEQIQKALVEFKEKGYVFATTGQVEVWKGLGHRLPERPNKAGTILCNLMKLERLPETLKHGGVLVMPKLSAHVHNFSFALSEKIMYWKHLMSLAVSQKFGDYSPPEEWYEEKWLGWDFKSNNENLQITEQDKNLQAIPYDEDELPEVIKAKYFP
ncbi:MAG: tetratricopeptide repeat protein [Thermodesulfovibrionales bacterium]|nr:tetratricopeptide repeat protein [Thermodesulfovibrionales bacterium]